MNLKVPIYFSAGLTIQANMYYKMLIGWTSQKIKETSSVRNTFDFKHVCPFDRSLINAPGPCVLFATPGMISGGFSLEVFKQWAPSELNLVTLPGYCVAGTIGHKLMSGKPTRIDLDKDTYVDVRCQIHQLSFSPHTDSKGIMDLVEYLSPKHVILVHGEKPKMAMLKERIQSELGIQCYYPANNEKLLISTTQNVKIDVTKKFIRSCSSAMLSNDTTAEGILLMEKTKTAKLIHGNELLHTLGVKEHQVRFAFCCPVEVTRMEPLSDEANTTLCHVNSIMKVYVPRNIQIASDSLQLHTFHVRVCSTEHCSYRKKENGVGESVVYFCCSWSPCDDRLAREVLQIMGQLALSC
ncbi:hypothetical protein BHM03_00024055 [Ensete ventricosum]|nr:hypothetical protein BHM03_00024055 [Ensete ventricosum]